MRIPILAFSMLLLAGCAGDPLRQPGVAAEDDVVAPDFVPPGKGALIVLAPMLDGQGLEEGQRLLEAQLQKKLEVAGYRVMQLESRKYQEFWVKQVIAKGGQFDPVTGARRTEVLPAALEGVGRQICDEMKCDVLVLHRFMSRTATLKGTYGEWDGVRRPIHFVSKDPRDFRGFRLTGQAPGLSLVLLGITRSGQIAFSQTAGVTLLNQTNIRAERNEPRDKLFPDDSEVADAATLALRPLTIKSVSR